MSTQYHPARPVVTAAHVQRAQELYETLPENSPDAVAALERWVDIEEEYVMQKRLYNLEVDELVKLLEHLK